MRIVDSNVNLNVQSGASRMQEQTSQTLVERPQDVAADFGMRQAKLEFTAQDSVALSSQSQKLAQTGGGDMVAAEHVRELTSERIVDTVVQGVDAWQAMSLHGSVPIGNVKMVAGRTVELQVETVVTQQLQQQSLFTAQGTVTDDNGNEIRFQLGLQMQSQSQLKGESEFTLIMKPRTDPLVINFDAASAELTDITFDFDLDADGRRETLAQLGSGSGYLVFDRNKNGVADDGTELFGVASGDGFADLREYDADGNMWLDEADPLFADLSVWVSDGNGASSLHSLHELGVGAIYLGASGDNFELTSSLGVPLGNVRAHSVVLMENGDVRTAQQLDLVDLKPTTPQQQLQQSAQQSTAITEPKAPQIQMQGVAIEGPDNTRAMIERLRWQQRERRRLAGEFEDRKHPSLLEQLLQKMEQQRERYREMQAMRERVGRLYTRE